MHDGYQPMDVAFELPRICSHFSEHSSQAMVAVEGRAFIVRHANAAFLKLAGATRSDLIGILSPLPAPMATPAVAWHCWIASLAAVNRKNSQNSCTAPRRLPTGPMPLGRSLASHDLPVGSMLQVTDSTEIAVFREHAVKMNESLLLAGIRQHEMVEASDVLNARLQTALKERTISSRCFRTNCAHRWRRC